MTQKYLDLIIMILGAGSQFISSYVLYRILAPNDYGRYGLLLTYIAIVFSFGLFGLEQTFLRLCVVDKGKVYLNKIIIILLCICLLVGPLFYAICAKAFFIKNMDITSLYFIALMSTYLMFIYNYKRITGDFVISQVANNLWRFALVLLLALSPYIQITFNILLTTILLAFFLCTLFFVYQMYTRVISIYPDKKIQARGTLGISVSFLFSMGTLTLLNHFDKYIITTKFNIDVFGEYFFLQNIFVSPFVLIANYFGFRKLVEYKKKFNYSVLKKEIISIIVISMSLGCSYVLIIMLLCHVFHLISYKFYDELSLILPLVIYGCIKIVYSNLSAVIGARGSKQHIFQANLISFFTLIAFVFIMSSLDVHIIYIVWSMVALWLLRSILYFYGTIKII